jgi:hypothetical protein
VAAGGAALSAGAGAVASAASALFGSAVVCGDGAASGSGGPGRHRPFSETGARPKRKVFRNLSVIPIFSFSHPPAPVMLIIFFSGWKFFFDFTF